MSHWGQVTHICVSKLTIIGSDNGLSPGRRQAIIWNNAGILLIEPLGTNFSEILIKIQTFSLKKIRLKMSSAKYCPFCLSLDVLTNSSHAEQNIPDLSRTRWTPWLLLPWLQATGHQQPWNWSCKINGSSSCTNWVLTNHKKYKYIFIFLKINSAWQKSKYSLAVHTFIGGGCWRKAACGGRSGLGRGSCKGDVVALTGGGKAGARGGSGVSCCHSVFWRSKYLQDKRGKFNTVYIIKQQPTQKFKFEHYFLMVLGLQKVPSIYQRLVSSVC